MKTVLKINNFIVKAEQVIIAAGILIVSLVLIGNVLRKTILQERHLCNRGNRTILHLRNHLHRSELCGNDRKHINMLGLFDMAPKKFRKIDAFIISGVTAATMGVLTGISFKYVSTLKLIGKVSINLQVPTYLVVAVIAFGFLFATLQYILIFIKNLQSDEIYLGLEKSICA